ncbi:MAG: pyrimidine-nucleoside phosphorylase [Actinobacteria bacterium]|nr:pyrimidine-nucleoside phosphorylase [Actinomycetota bacterium]
MRAYDIIFKKRWNKILSSSEIDFMVKGFVKGVIPNYQMSAFLMAIAINGMNTDETLYLTKSFVDSGDIIDLSSIPGIKVDKHSSGGVGDTTTLIVAPIVAEAGIPVAKMSGKGLGHSGGTIDKLESIPGFSTKISKNDFINQVKDIGIAVVGKIGNVVTADELIYALRDVTATVDSLPLIASSIMSKKIAGGADAIVLDVKVGSGAFIEDEEKVEKLAKIMVNIGKGFGKKTRAIITDMSQPLGNAIGNSLEVEEAIKILKGNGSLDLREVCINIAANMLLLGQKVKDLEEGIEITEEILTSGRGLDKFKQFISHQGGNSNIVEDISLLTKARYKDELLAKYNGFISKIDCKQIGIASIILGAGREKKEDIIDPSVGIVMEKRLGDNVKIKDKICTIYGNDFSKIEEAKKILEKSIEISDKKGRVPILIKKIID